MNRDARSEGCAACGRPTKVGTALFSDRLTAHGDDGNAIFLCSACNERAVSHYGRRLTDRDMVQIAARGAGLGFVIGGPGAGAGPL
jgi:hypothetical protein